MQVDFNAIPSSCILPCSSRTGFRDPAAIIHQGSLYCFYSFVETDPEGWTCFCVGMSVTEDLIHWHDRCLLTPRDRSKNWSSPGSVLRLDDGFAMCVQTYPNAHNPPGNSFGDGSSRIYLMRSRDLLHWSEPELMRVHGDEVPEREMGRMIDPFIIEDTRTGQGYLTFYKQHPKDVPHRMTANGYPVEYMCFSSSQDLVHFRDEGYVECGENVCVIPWHGGYRIYNSPRNGIACLITDDFRNFVREAPLTLGQESWPWAASRITAGFVLDARETPGVGKYLMFFHGDQKDSFPFCASIGLAWSDDLMTWQYR